MITTNYYKGAPSSNPLPPPPAFVDARRRPRLRRRPRAPSSDVMHAALRRVASRALARAPARAPSTIARRSYASDPNAPPKVPYPWHDPMNPSNWKEEHVRLATRRARPRRAIDRATPRRARDRSIRDALDACATIDCNTKTKTDDPRDRSRRAHARRERRARSSTNARGGIRKPLADRARAGDTGARDRGQAVERFED